MDLSVDDKSRKKEGYIEITANVYLDVAVLEPTAFTVCKDNNCLILKSMMSDKTMQLSGSCIKIKS
jgi:hypothetical protein